MDRRSTGLSVRSDRRLYLLREYFERILGLVRNTCVLCLLTISYINAVNVSVATLFGLSPIKITVIEIWSY